MAALKIKREKISKQDVAFMKKVKLTALKVTQCLSSCRWESHLSCDLYLHVKHLSRHRLTSHSPVLSLSDSSCGCTSSADVSELISSRFSLSDGAELSS